MPNTLLGLYQQAVATGDTPAANWYAQALAAQAGININVNEVTAASPSLVLPNSNSGASPSNSGSSGFNWAGAADAFLQGILHPLDTLSGQNTVQMNADAASTGNAVSKAVSSTGSALSFLTDIPRLVTSLLGLILIIVGLFALTRGPVVNIVSSKLKEQAFS